MEKKYFTLAAFFLCILFIGTSAYALPASYGTATHNNPRWQQLATYEDGVKTSDSGVFWSVDNGATWGHETELYVGQEVQFKFGMHKNDVGTHYADFLKSWVDWGQDGAFDTTDVIAFNMQELLTNETGNLGSDTPNVPDYTFYSGTFTLTAEYIGDLFLRTRVVCSESLAKSMGYGWNKQWKLTEDQYRAGFSSTGYLYQGEVEEWQITVNAAPVPEPATFVLLGFGLLGLGAFGRKVKKNMK